MMPTHTQCACTPGSVLTGVHLCARACLPYSCLEAQTLESWAPGCVYAHTCVCGGQEW